MRQFVVFTALAASLLSVAPASAAEPPSPPAQGDVAAAKPAKPDKNDPNRLICTREAVVGSNRPQKVCMTAAERARLKDAASASMRNDRGTDYSAPTNLPGS